MLVGAALLVTLEVHEYHAWFHTMFLYSRGAGKQAKFWQILLPGRAVNSYLNQSYCMVNKESWFPIWKWIRSYWLEKHPGRLLTLTLLFLIKRRAKQKWETDILVTTIGISITTFQLWYGCGITTLMYMGVSIYFRSWDSLLIYQISLGIFASWWSSLLISW